MTKMDLFFRLVWLHRLSSLKRDFHQGGQQLLAKSTSPSASPILLLLGLVEVSAGPLALLALSRSGGWCLGGGVSRGCDSLRADNASGASVGICRLIPGAVTQLRADDEVCTWEAIATGGFTVYHINSRSLIVGEQAAAAPQEHDRGCTSEHFRISPPIWQQRSQSIVSPAHHEGPGIVDLDSGRAKAVTKGGTAEDKGSGELAKTSICVGILSSSHRNHAGLTFQRSQYRWCQ